MRTIPSLKKHHYLKRVGIFLVVVALVAGIVSCTPTDTYDLTMAADPVGGGTATDETNASPYARNDVVDIKAVPDPCYRFVNWSAPAGQFGNANDVTTNFTMPAEAVTVTANFEPKPPDHFKFYAVDEGGKYIGKDVQLVDQFGAINATVGYAVSFGNPVEKVHTGVTPMPISDPNNHLTLYELEYEGEPQSWQVTVNNQFGNNQELTVIGPFYLAVPTQKKDHQEWECLDHFLVYDAYGPVVNDEVLLTDQFIEEQVAVVYEPWLFANPVKKTVGSEVTEIQTDEHYVFYDIAGESIGKTIQIDNQFGSETLDLLNPEYLAVPSQKIAWEQPLDHFKGYLAEWPEGIPPPWFPVEVQLKDQFHEFDAITANVTDPFLFANPVDKWYLDELTPMSNPNNHLTLYWLEYDEAAIGWWDVTVSNQFGNDQWLRVIGPLFLAVPTQKEGHEEWECLDHFLVYGVTDWDNEPVEVVVDLWDQFTLYNEGVGVDLPILFANPVQKTIVDSGKVTDIKNPDDHLLFYLADGGYFIEEGLPIANQFGSQILYVSEGGGAILGVPSQKIVWEPYEPT